ncbi:hypothetical protein ABZ901_34835 [Actinacidiphila alni]
MATELRSAVPAIAGIDAFLGRLIQPSVLARRHGFESRWLRAATC